MCTILMDCFFKAPSLLFFLKTNSFYQKMQRAEPPSLKILAVPASGSGTTAIQVSCSPRAQGCNPWSSSQCVETMCRANIPRVGQAVRGLQQLGSSLVGQWAVTSSRWPAPTRRPEEIKKMWQWNTRQLDTETEKRVLAENPVKYKWSVWFNWWYCWWYWQG